MKTLKSLLISLFFLMGFLWIMPLAAQPDNYNCTCSLCHCWCNAPLSAHTNPDCPIGKSQNQSSGQTTSYNTEPAALPVLSDAANEHYTEYLLEQARIVNNRGVEAYKKGNYAAAAAAFRKALKYDRNNSMYSQNLDNAETMLKREKAKQAKQKPVNNNSAAATEYLAEMKAFSDCINENKKSYQTVQKKLNKQLGSYVPPLRSRKVVKEGVILGMSNTASENSIVKNKLVSPFSGNNVPFYATSDNAAWTDLGRVSLDNLTTGKYTSLNTEVGKELVKELDNTYFEILMAHSNGATVTEALLRADVIQAKELHIMGGDRSLTNMGGYADLIATGKVEKVVVWLNPADYVPYGTSLVDMFMNGSHDKNLQVENFNAYFQHIADELKATSNIDYRWLSGPEFSDKGQTMRLTKDNAFDAHDLKIYWDNIRTYRSLSPEKQQRYNYNMWDWLK